MSKSELNIAGVIPAAGNATRLSPIPCSKEIFPVGFSENTLNNRSQIKVAVEDLLQSFAIAGADQVYMILQKGKWDIPEYLGLGMDPAYSMAYIATEPTAGTHYTIDLSYPFVKNRLVLLGFPDILVTPKNAFQLLMDKQRQTQADIVLGLFHATNPQKADMVAIDEQGRVENIIIKPSETMLKYTWTTAVWTPAFSTFLHQFVTKEKQANVPQSELAGREIFIGDVIMEAIRSDFTVDTVCFDEGEYVDIGTLPDLKKALRKGIA